MSSEVSLKISPERLREMPMVDLAFEVLKSTNSPMYYRDLIMEIARLRGLSADQINEVIAQVYTEINIDGRFACVGSNVWGLKRWYPVDKNEGDPVGNAKRPRIINDDDDDDEELFADEEEETYVADEEDYDLYDEDREDFEEAEEEAEVDEEAIEDEELGEDAIEDEELGEEAAEDEEEAFEDDLDADDDER